MRQQWIARWEEGGGERTYCFISLVYENLARISFEVALMWENKPVPQEYRLEKLGEPFEDERRTLR